MPPGTWLTSAMSCDASNAPASHQSSAESTNCEPMSGADGNQISVPATDTGSFQYNGAAAYAAAIASRITPVPRVSHTGAKLSIRVTGLNRRLHEPSRIKPSQNVPE